MLSSISWTDFLLVLAILAGAYYLVAVLVFYRQEFADFVRNGKVNFRRPPSVVPQSKESPKEAVSLMGAALGDDHFRISPGTQQETSDELSYAGSDELPEEVQRSGSDDFLVGNISDLLEEIKAICHAMVNSNAEKAQATSLFETLLSRYQQLKGTPYEKSISDYIYSVTRDPFPVQLTRAEIEDFWKQEN
jgi:hypothetical protein